MHSYAVGGGAYYLEMCVVPASSVPSTRPRISWSSHHFCRKPTTSNDGKWNDSVRFVRYSFLPANLFFFNYRVRSARVFFIVHLVEFETSSPSLCSQFRAIRTAMRSARREGYILWAKICQNPMVF